MPSLQDDLKSVVSDGRAAKRLPSAPARTAIGPGTGLARDSAAAGGGIASPLTEPDYTAREWHPVQTITSTDGLFVLEVSYLKAVSMLDAADRAVVFNFADKPME